MRRTDRFQRWRGLFFVGAALFVGCSGAQGEESGDQANPAREHSTAGDRSVPVAGAELTVEIGSVVVPTLAVGPPPGHPLESIDRDAGVSAQLSDGSVVWFFGDTASYYPNGSLRYFEIGTAAWAPSETPTVTSDYSKQSRPVPFAQPGADFPTCERATDEPGMWPLAAAVEPTEGRDRVLVWMGNICLGSNRAAVNKGISIAEWWYDPATPPAGEPVMATVLSQNLFPPEVPRFGDAVLPDGDGGVYVYGCDFPGDAEDPAGGPCRVAQVDLAGADDPSAYRIWNGESWAEGNEPAELDFIGTEDGVGVPRGSFSVVRTADSAAVVIGYSPWPSYTDSMEIRVAAGPAGPFGAPTEVPLPNCDDTLAGQSRRCYAANVQPFLTGSGTLGVGWYDQMVAPGSPLGSFVVSQVPLTVTPLDTPE